MRVEAQLVDSIIEARAELMGTIEARAELVNGIRIVDYDPYPGPYEVTPSSSSQTLGTNDMRMTDDIVVMPIPSNYGLITWNGSTLTVS